MCPTLMVDTRTMENAAGLPLPGHTTADPQSQTCPALMTDTRTMKNVVHSVMNHVTDDDDKP